MVTPNGGFYAPSQATVKSEGVIYVEESRSISLSALGHEQRPELRGNIDWLPSPQSRWVFNRLKSEFLESHGSGQVGPSTGMDCLRTTVSGEGI